MFKNYGVYENGVFTGAESSDGLIFKDVNAFNNKEGVCYLSSHVFENIPIEEEVTLQAISEIGETDYTYNDFLELCDGNHNAAEYVFSCVTWEEPSTTLEQLISNGILCEYCLDEIEDGEECPREECIAKNNN